MVGARCAMGWPGTSGQPWWPRPLGPRLKAFSNILARVPRMRQPFGQLRLPKGCLVWPRVNKVGSGHTSLEESPHSAGPLGGRRVRRSLGAAFCGRGLCPRPRMVAPLPPLSGCRSGLAVPLFVVLLAVGVLLGVQVRQSRLAKIRLISLRLLLHLSQVC